MKLSKLYIACIMITLLILSNCLTGCKADTQETVAETTAQVTTEETVAEETAEKEDAAPEIEGIVGQWGCTYTYDDGTAGEDIFTVNEDGTAYYMTLGEDIGIRITSIYSDVWKKTGENEYEVQTIGGHTYKQIYDPKNDTLTETVVDYSDDGKIVFARLDPVVGIWSASDEGINKTTIIKTDGTGLLCKALEDGTAECDRLTWTNSGYGKYQILYGNGQEREYTLDESGLTLQSGDGNANTKEFVDFCFLMTITGPWYCEDNGALAIFNANGTGTIKAGDRLLIFDWEAEKGGTFRLIYTSGTWKDGSDATGKETVWTLDGERNIFISSYGSEYKRVDENVEGRITIAELIAEEDMSIIAGGWSDTEDSTLTEEVLGYFSTATEGLLGASYEPLKLLGTQVVAGTNYRILCNVTAVAPDTEQEQKVVTMYVDLQGNSSIIEVVDAE